MTTLQMVGGIIAVIALSTLGALVVASWMGHCDRTRI